MRRRTQPNLLTIFSKSWYRFCTKVHIILYGALGSAPQENKSYGDPHTESNKISSVLNQI